MVKQDQIKMVRYMHDNYGPTVWGGTAERWDLDQLNPSQQTW